MPLQIQTAITEKEGFVFRTFPPLGEIPEDEEISVTMTSKECGDIQAIAEMCLENKIELLLVNPPQLVEEKFDKPECMKGLKWIEGNDWSGAKDPRNFYDDHHLVGEGAQRYSRWLSLSSQTAGKIAPLTSPKKGARITTVSPS